MGNGQTFCWMCGKGKGVQFKKKSRDLNCKGHQGKITKIVFKSILIVIVAQQVSLLNEVSSN